LWSVGDVIIREQSSWRRHSCATCGVEGARKPGIGEIEKQKREEQKE